MSGGAPRTALVHDWLTGMRGGEKVLEALSRSFPGAPIYTLFHFPGSVSRRIEEHPIHTSFLQRAPFLKRRYRHYLPFFPAAVEDFDLSGYDLVVSTSHCVAKGAIPAPGAFHICYCHTPMRYAWDQEHAYFPRRRGPEARLRQLILSRLRTWDAASAARVDLFVANSRFVAERIRRYYGRTAEVLPPPVDVEHYTPGGGDEGADPEGREYALTVSALAPYKRVEVAIEACKQAGLPLNVVGTGPEMRRLRRRAGAGVHFLGRVGDEELRRLYRGAVCLLQPQVEDFGIAAVEALACGTPVVALGRGGVVDIVEDGRHGLLVADAGGNAGSLAATLAAAIDKARRIQFNQLDLRQRAEQFSAGSFDRSFKSLLGTSSSRRELLP